MLQILGEIGEKVLLKLFSMSITAGIAVLFVLAARVVFNRLKAPKIFSYALWGIVLFRLLCPVSFSMPFSVFALLPDFLQEKTWQTAQGAFKETENLFMDSASDTDSSSDTWKPLPDETAGTGETVFSEQIPINPDDGSFTQTNPEYVLSRPIQGNAVKPTVSLGENSTGVPLGKDNNTGVPLGKDSADKDLNVSGEESENTENDYVLSEPIQNGPVSPTNPAGGRTSALSFRKFSSGEFSGIFVWLSVFWLAGIAVLITVNFCEYLQLKKKTACSIRHSENENVYLADEIGIPCCIGIFTPKIYLPSTLSDKEQEYVLLHEKHHLARKDYIVKPVAFLALCLHWFNPFVWIAFVLAGKDMEMSCDEAVLKKADGDIRAAYATSILELAAGRKLFSVSMLAFGEGNPKQRIEHIMNYKKSGTCSVLAACILSIAVIGCAGTNAGMQKNPDASAGTGTSQQKATVTPTPKPSHEALTGWENLNIGDTVYFGSYEQDAEEENGAELIEWMVLDKREDKVLLLSSYILEEMRYHDVKDPKTETTITWKDCTLRKWLNYEFFDTAFTDAEKAHILWVTLENPDFPEVHSTGKSKEKNQTTDRVFLLSLDEIRKYFSVRAMGWTWKNNGDARLCANRTKYAHKKKWGTTVGCTPDRTGAWILRSSGVSPDNHREYAVHKSNVSGVMQDGSVNKGGALRIEDFCSVRPAIWVSFAPNTTTPAEAVTVSEYITLDRSNYETVLHLSDGVKEQWKALFDASGIVTVRQQILPDIDGNGQVEQAWMLSFGKEGVSGPFCHLALELNGEIIFLHEEPIDNTAVSFAGVTEYLDFDHDGEKEILLSMEPYVNSRSLVEYAVLKYTDGAWKKLEMLEHINEYGNWTNAFPISVVKGEKTEHVIISCQVGETSASADGRLDVYNQFVSRLVGKKHITGVMAESAAVEVQAARYYAEVFVNLPPGEPCGRTADWGIWGIRAGTYDGQPCIIATHGIEGDDVLQMEWGVAEVSFDYDENGNIRILCMNLSLLG